MSASADSNDNGRSEVLVRRAVGIIDPTYPFLGPTPPAFRADAIELPGPASSARGRTRGAGCPGASDAIRRIDFRGAPRLGETVHIRLEAARPNSTALLHFGQSIPTPVDLDFLGAPGCVVHTDPFITLGAGTSDSGFANLPVTIPANAAPPGFEFSAQWLMWDPGANALGVTTTGELRLRVGT